MTIGESGELQRNGGEPLMENDPEEKEVCSNDKKPQSHHHPFLGFLSKATASGTTSEQLISLICSTQYQLAMHKTKKSAPMVMADVEFASTDASNLLLAAAEAASVAGPSRGNALRLVKYVVHEEDRWNGSEAFEKALIRGRRDLPMTLVADAGFMALSSQEKRISELAGLKFVCDIEDPDPRWQLASIKLLGTLSSNGGTKSRELLATRLKNSFNLNQHLVYEILGQIKRALKRTKLSRGEREKEDPLHVAWNEYMKHLSKKESGGGHQEGQQKGSSLRRRDFGGGQEKLKQHANQNPYTDHENSTDIGQECGGGTTQQNLVRATHALEGLKVKKEQGNQQKMCNSKPLKKGEGGPEILQQKKGLEGHATLAVKQNVQHHCKEHLGTRMCKKQRFLDEEHASVSDKELGYIHSPDRQLQDDSYYHKGVIVGEEDNNGSRVAVGVEESVTGDISNVMTKKSDNYISRSTPCGAAVNTSYDESTSPVGVEEDSFTVHHEADRKKFCREGDGNIEESLAGDPHCDPVDYQEGRKYEVVLGRGWNSMGENKSSRAQQLTGGGLLCIHYDFLPQSADMEEPGELKLRDNGTATVELKSMDQSGTPLSYEGSYVSRLAKSIQSNSVLRFTNGHFVLDPVDVIVQGLRNDFAEANKGMKKKRSLGIPKSHGHCTIIGDNKCESSLLRHDMVGGGSMDMALGGIGGHHGGFKAKLQKMGSRVEKSKELQKTNLVENERSITMEVLPTTE